MRDVAGGEGRIHFDDYRTLGGLEGQRVAGAAHDALYSSWEGYFFSSGAKRSEMILSGFHRAVVGLRAGLDLVDVVHARDDFAEHGVFAVQEAKRRQSR